MLSPFLCRADIVSLLGFLPQMLIILASDFLMTYDDTGKVRALARQCNFDTEIVAMKTTHHAEMNELLIERNLDWARASFQDVMLPFPVAGTPASA
jgi:hypothetical protein